MRVFILLVMLALLLLGTLAVPAQASMFSGVLDKGLSFLVGPNYAQQVSAATTWALNTPVSPDGYGELLLLGANENALATGLQRKFGGYDGHPFLFEVGYLTNSSAQYTPEVGFGTSVGTIKKASVNGYVAFASSKVTGANLPPAITSKVGVTAAVGVTFKL